MKTCLWAYADNEGPDQPAYQHSPIRAFAAVNRIIDYYKIFQWSVQTPDETAHAQYALRMRSMM